MRQVNIPLDKLFVSTLNARKDLHAGQEEGGINELASSIQQQGLLSPPIVRPSSDGRFEILVGQRRFLACKKLGLDPMPCLVKEGIGDIDAAALSLVENIHRADMHPLDKARSLKALYDRHQSYERVAHETAWSVSTIRKYVQLLSLPEELQQRLGTSTGAAGVGALARLASTFAPDEAVGVYERISGFNQTLQVEILKRSNGNLDAIEDLVQQAQEGAFNIRRCDGACGCEVIRDIVEGRLSRAEFQKLVSEAAATLEEPSSENECLRNATQAFWKALATE